MDSNKENNFQISFLQQVAKLNKDKNILISPMSIFLALAITATGSEGTTQSEMLKTLLQGKNLSDLEKYCKEVLDLLGKLSSVQVANAVLTKVKPEKNFVDACKNFKALIDQLVSAEQVNKWCSDKTNGKIAKIVDSVQDLEMCILNAVYFNGKWRNTFNKNSTFNLAFVKENGEEKEVPMMGQVYDGAQFYEDEKMQMLLIPYTEQGLEAVICLPNTKTKIDDFISGLTNDYLCNALLYTETKKVNATIPKFKIESTIECKELLQSMGIKIAFSDGADFSKMTKETKLKISEVTQKTYIDVNEEGTEAAAVTKVGMKRCMMADPRDIPVRFLCNRPFLFMVWNHDVKDMCLFMAKIASL